MSNKSRAKPNTMQQEKMKAAMQGLVEKFKDVQAQRDSGNEDSVTEVDADQFVMPMPDTQVIGEHEISWLWGIEKLTMGVKAVYHKGTDPKTAIKAGAYTVSLWCGVLTEGTWQTSGPNAKHIAEILASAAKWETEWRSHAGLYLENNGKLPEVMTAPVEHEHGDGMVGTSPNCVVDDEA